MLEGVGDADLGEWEERGPSAYHIRRRLSAIEQQVIGDACDLRCTREAEERLSRAWRWLPPEMRQAALGEISEDGA